MLTKTVFVDQDNKELECYYLASKNIVQIYVGTQSDEQSWRRCDLDKEGVEKLIKTLNELKDEIVLF